MISPSEVTEASESGVEVLSPGLLDRQPASTRVVSRLEFQSVEHPAAEVVVTAKSGEENDDSKLRLKEEVAALDVRLQMQEQQLEEQLESARSAARADARHDWGAELEQSIAAEREQVVRTCEEFGRERSRYFADVEAEVVKLSLAIAARVLHREVKLDPLLLSAVVRVALEKVEQDSATVLRVPVEHVEQWRELFVSAESSVQVVEDERLKAGDCVLETHVGKIELGVSAQLVEIERGFFDLLQQRPA